MRDRSVTGSRLLGDERDVRETLLWLAEQVDMLVERSKHAHHQRPWGLGCSNCGHHVLQHLSGEGRAFHPCDFPTNGPFRLCTCIDFQPPVSDDEL